MPSLKRAKQPKRQPALAVRHLRQSRHGGQLIKLNRHGDERASAEAGRRAGIEPVIKKASHHIVRTKAITRRAEKTRSTFLALTAHQACSKPAGRKIQHDDRPVFVLMGTNNPGASLKIKAAARMPASRQHRHQHQAAKNEAAAVASPSPTRYRVMNGIHAESEQRLAKIINITAQPELSPTSSLQAATSRPVTRGRRAVREIRPAR